MGIHLFGSISWATRSIYKPNGQIKTVYDPTVRGWCGASQALAGPDENFYPSETFVSLFAPGQMIPDCYECLAFWKQFSVWLDALKQGGIG